MNAWNYITEQYGCPIKMKLNISELKRKLFNVIKEREEKRKKSMSLLCEIDDLKKILIKNGLSQEMWNLYKENK